MRQIRRVLVIDEAAPGAATRELLVNAGAAVTVDIASDAKQAVRYIEQHEFRFPEQLPDLVLLEININGGQGLLFLDKFGDFDTDTREKMYLTILTSVDDADILETAGKSPYVEMVLKKPLTKELIQDLQIKVEQNLKKEG